MLARGSSASMEHLKPGRLLACAGKLSEVRASPRNSRARRVHWPPVPVAIPPPPPAPPAPAPPVPEDIPEEPMPLDPELLEPIPLPELFMAPLLDLPDFAFPLAALCVVIVFASDDPFMFWANEADPNPIERLAATRPMASCFLFIAFLVFKLPESTLANVHDKPEFRHGQRTGRQIETDGERPPSHGALEFGKAFYSVRRNCSGSVAE